MSILKISNKIKKLALMSMIPKEIMVKQFAWRDHKKADKWSNEMKKRGLFVFAEDAAGDTLTLISARGKEMAIKELASVYTKAGVKNLQPKLIEYK